MSEDFGAKVRLRRLKLGFTQTYLADHAGISRNYLSQIERGLATNPSHLIVSRIKDCLSIESFDKPVGNDTASCYLCGTSFSLHMVPHRKASRLVGWIFSCGTCGPKLYGAELTSTMPHTALDSRLTANG